MGFSDDVLKSVMSWPVPSAGSPEDYLGALVSHLCDSFKHASVTQDSKGILLRRKGLLRGRPLLVVPCIELATESALDELLGKVLPAVHRGHRVFVAIIGYYKTDLFTRVSKEFLAAGSVDLMGYSLFRVIHLPRSPEVPVESLPSLALERLHPDIVLRCRSLYSTKHYSQSVLEAFKVVESKVREMSKCSHMTGKQLIEKAFDPAAPLIAFGDSENKDPKLAGREQSGFISLFAGAMTTLRNPPAHELVVQPDGQKAFEQLAFASMLMRLLDAARLQN